MTVDEYLAHEPEEEKSNSKQILGVLDSGVEVWARVWWRLFDEQFLGWYIWLKENLALVEGFVREIKAKIEVRDH